jgi:hypothetical protein
LSRVAWYKLTELSAAINNESDLRSLRSTDPVSLHRLDALGPVQFVQILQQTVSISSDLQHPLTHKAALDGFTRFHILAVLDLFVGQNRALRRAPVDGHLRLIGKAALVEFQEDPLRPAHEVWVR